MWQMEKYIMQTKFSSSLIQFSREVWSEQPLLEYNSWLKNASSNAFIPVDIFIDFFKGFDITYKEGTALLMCTNYMMVSWYSLRLTASFLLTFILKFAHRFSKNTYKLLNPHVYIFTWVYHASTGSSTQAALWKWSNIDVWGTFSAPSQRDLWHEQLGHCSQQAWMGHSVKPKERRRNVS